jgi:hypothetical protein
MESNTLNSKNPFQVTLDLLEESWPTIFSEKPSLNQWQNQSMKLKSSCMKRSETSTPKSILNHHSSSDLYVSRTFIFYSILILAQKITKPSESFLENSIQKIKLRKQK